MLKFDLNFDLQSSIQVLSHSKNLYTFAILIKVHQNSISMEKKSQEKTLVRSDKKTRKIFSVTYLWVDFMNHNIMVQFTFQLKDNLIQAFLNRKNTNQ